MYYFSIVAIVRNILGNRLVLPEIDEGCPKSSLWFLIPYYSKNTYSLMNYKIDSIISYLRFCWQLPKPSDDSPWPACAIPAIWPARVARCRRLAVPAACSRLRAEFWRPGCCSMAAVWSGQSNGLAAWWLDRCHCWLWVAPCVGRGFETPCHWNRSRL